MRHRTPEWARAAAGTLLSLGRPSLVVVSRPSAPLASRVLSDRRVVALSRGLPWYLLLAAVAVLTLAVLVPGARSAASGENGFAGSLGVATGAVLALGCAALVPVLVVAVLAVSEACARTLDGWHASLLGRLPGVVALVAPGTDVLVALAGVRSLRTPAGEEFVDRVLPLADSPSRWSTSSDVLLALASHGGDGFDESLLDLARGGRDGGLVDAVLRLASLLPLDADYGSVYGGRVDRDSLEGHLDVVVAVARDLAFGAPFEWALRRGASRGSS